MARRFFIKCFLSVFGLCIGFSFQASETVGFFVKTNLDQFYIEISKATINFNFAPLDTILGL